MKKYAIYLRKSRADLELEKIEKMETLEKHRQILQELAKKQGLDVVDIYEEIVSGESIEARPQMQKLLEAVWQKKYSGVLVVEVERLARGNTKDQGEVSEAFKYSNTLIITPMKTYDPNNEFDEEYFEFGLFMSRREYKTIRRRMMAGKIESVKSGNYIGTHAPFGYDKVKLGKKDLTLVPNEQAKVVRMIYHWYVDDKMGIAEITRTLETMGIPTKNGNAHWNVSVVVDILHNPLYIGKIAWGKKKGGKELIDGELVYKTRRKKDYQLYDGKHEAIISKDLYDEAQKLHQHTHASVNVDKKLRNPFASLLKCEKCGGNLVLWVDNGTASSRITHRERKGCDVKTINYNRFVSAFCEGMSAAIQDFEVKIENEPIEIETNTIDILEKELETCNKIKEALMDYLEKKIYTPNEYIERKEKVVAKIRNIEMQLEAEQQKQKAIDYEEIVSTYRKALETFKDETVSAKVKNDYLKGIIDRIELGIEDYGRGKGGKPILNIFFKK